MEKQELSRLLGNIAQGLDSWDNQPKTELDEIALNTHLACAFHDVEHLVLLEAMISERTNFDDCEPPSCPECNDPNCGNRCPELPFAASCLVPCNACPDEPIPPTQRTGDEEPTKTQVDQAKPAPSGVAGDQCGIGNECGRIGCPSCQQ